MNICCIYTVENYVAGNKPLQNLQGLHFGLAYIATILKNAGYDTQLLVLTPQANITRALKSYIDRHNPKLICLTAVTNQYPFVVDIAQEIKRLQPNIHILLGGNHASLNPQETIREGCFDAICIMEGERAAVEYADQLNSGNEPTQIANLWIKNRLSGAVEKNEPAPFVCDLDSLPYVDLEMWERWTADTSRMMNVLVGRGCPYRCTYCSNHALARLSSGRYVRFRSPDNVVGEIARFVDNYPQLSAIQLRAETFSVHLEYTFALLERLAEFNSSQPKPLSFILNLSPGKGLAQNKDLLAKLKAANVKYVNMALESGSRRIRKEILKRPPYTNDDVISLCRQLKAMGIRVGISNMIGLPGETRADFKKTVQCLRACNPDHSFLFIFYPYPGTDLYHLARQMKLFSGDIIETTSERKIARYDQPGFSKRQIQREFLFFYYNVYKGVIPSYKIASRIIREIIFINPHLNALFRRLMKTNLMKQIAEKVSTDPVHSFLI